MQEVGGRIELGPFWRPHPKDTGVANRLTVGLIVGCAAFALTAFAAVAATTTSPAAQSAAYSYLIQRGIVRGDPAGNRTGEKAFVTRAVYAQLVLRAFPAKAKTVGVEGAWPQGPIRSLGALQVLPSIRSFQQAPQQDISRQDAVLIAVRCAQITPSVMRTEIIRRSQAPFSDEAQIEPAARSAAHLAVSLGLIATTPDGHYGLFRPIDNITMGETAVLITGLVKH